MHNPGRVTNNPGFQPRKLRERGTVVPENGIRSYEVGKSAREKEETPKKTEDVKERKLRFRSRSRVRFRR